MPRVTAAHEREVRERIIRAAIGVFDDRGYHRATMQDVVRASGLSVGAIYTYFGGKDELFLAACDLSMDQGVRRARRPTARAERSPTSWPSPSASSSTRSIRSTRHARLGRPT